MFKKYLLTDLHLLHPTSLLRMWGGCPGRTAWRWWWWWEWNRRNGLETLFLLSESIRRTEEGMKVYWLCYERELAQLLAYIRVQTGDLEANVLFGLHDAKETFQLIANIYKSGDPHAQKAWMGADNSGSIFPVASIAGVTISCPFLMGYPLFSLLQTPPGPFTHACY